MIVPEPFAAISGTTVSVRVIDRAWGALWVVSFAFAIGCTDGANEGDDDGASGSSASGSGGTVATAGNAGNAAGMGAAHAGSGGTSAQAGSGNAGTSATAGSSAAGTSGMNDAGPHDAGSDSDAQTAGDSGIDPNADPLSTDRDLFFGASRCASADFIVCEDFESRAVGESADPARFDSFGDDPVIDDARAARGSKSLHVHTEGNAAAGIETTQFFPAEGNAFYGRMFVWIDALPTNPQWAHWTLVAGNGDGDGSEIRVGGQWDGERNRWGVGTDHGDTGDWTRLDDGPAAEPPVQQWVCIEWLYDGGSDQVRFFQDATEHTEIAASRDDHGGADVPFVLPEFDRLGLGWWHYQPNPTPDHFDVWIDEIALDDERIGCVR